MKWTNLDDQKLHYHQKLLNYLPLAREFDTYVWKKF